MAKQEDSKDQENTKEAARGAGTFPLRRDQAEFLAQVLPTAIYPSLTALAVGNVLFIAQQLRQWLAMQEHSPEQKGDTDEP